MHAGKGDLLYDVYIVYKLHARDQIIQLSHIKACVINYQESREKVWNTCMHYIYTQWNPSIAATLGEQNFGRYLDPTWSVFAYCCQVLYF